MEGRGWGLDIRHWSLRTLDRIRDAGIFDPGGVKLILYGVRFLPKGSYHQVLYEGIAMGALSLHIIHDLFCRDFRGSAERFSRSELDYRLRPPAAV